MCYLHPDRKPVGSCLNCGQLVCAECEVFLNERIYCSPCAEKIYTTNVVTPQQNSITKETKGQMGPDKVWVAKNIADYRNSVMMKLSLNKPEFQIVDDLVKEGFELKQALDYVRHLSNEKNLKNSNPLYVGMAVGSFIGLVSWWPLREVVANMLDYDGGFSVGMMAAAGIWVSICGLTGRGLVWLLERKSGK